MKRLVLIMAVIIAVAFVVADSAMAETKMVPKGTVVSATCNGDNTATVKVSGVRVESYEKYDYEGVKREQAGARGEFVHDLDEGRRLNFTHSGGYYSFLTREMGKVYGGGVSQLGPNIDIDGSNAAGGASYIITCPVRR